MSRAWIEMESDEALHSYSESMYGSLSIMGTSEIKNLLPTTEQSVSLIYFKNLILSHKATLRNKTFTHLTGADVKSSGTYQKKTLMFSLKTSFLQLSHSVETSSSSIKYVSSATENYYSSVHLIEQ